MANNENPEEEVINEEARGFFARIHGDWVEIAAAVLLALATLASAWSAYQSARWHGVQSREFNQSNAERVKASEETSEGEQEVELDSEMFVDYMASWARGDTQAMDFFENTMFSSEMKVAFEAWMATDPFNNPAAPDTPFEMQEYRNEHLQKADELEKSAAKKAETARKAIEHADNYVLLTVLFASVLFFAGISSKFKSPHTRLGLLSMGWILFIGSLIVLLFQPVK